MANKRNALRKQDIHLKLPSGPKTSGHEVDLGSFTNNTETGYIAWITKLNKHEGNKGVNASVLEVAFSELASLYIKPGLTPPAKTVLDENNQVIGVASENFNVQISKIQDCCAFNPKTWGYQKISGIELTDEKKESERLDLGSRTSGNESDDQELMQNRQELKKAQSAVNFMDKMPHDFFHQLMQKNKKGEVAIDMDSLASILSVSYALEEDDLHKGNIGFYVTESQNINGETIPKFTFFKIDHDLMFTDSIMSKEDMRVANILYGKDSFKITARDLDNFPDLKDSGNHYWPTQNRLFAAGDKAYKNARERQAFANLKKDENFIKSKWKNFLKIALVPAELVEKSLTMHLDPKDDIDKINMIRNSVSSRIAQLKQTLLESNKFMAFLKGDDGKLAKESIKEEIAQYMEKSTISLEDKEGILQQIDEDFDLLIEAKPDSSLKHAITIDVYRFSYQGNPDINDIKLAFAYFEKNTKINNGTSAFKYACIVEDLVKKFKDPDAAHFLEAVTKFKKDHYLKPHEVTSLDDFKRVADRIRASDLPLKQQKYELVAVLKEAKLPVEELIKLKTELKKNEPDDPSLKFVNQLRSDFWLIRKISNTYSTRTTTNGLLLKEIDSKLQNKLSINAISIEARKDSHVFQPIKDPVDIGKFKQFKNRYQTVSAEEKIAILKDFSTQIKRTESLTDLETLEKELKGKPEFQKIQATKGVFTAITGINSTSENVFEYLVKMQKKILASAPPVLSGNKILD